MPRYRYTADASLHDAIKYGDHAKVTLYKGDIVEGKFINKSDSFADLSLDSGTIIMSVNRNSFKSVRTK